MNFVRSFRIADGARPFWVALAVLAVLCLATPTASALDIQFKTLDVGASTTTGPIDLGSGGSSSAVNSNFNYTVSSSSPLNTGGATGNSTLGTNTLTLNNSSSVTDTLDITVSGTGFLAGVTGGTLFVNFSMGGSGGPASTAKDSTTGSSWIDFTNTLFGTQHAITPNQTIVPTGNSTGTTVSYTNATSPTLAFAIPSGAPPWAMTQLLAITLGAGDFANLTITTGGFTTPPNTVPEPSTLAIAGLGGLGLIGFGLRRRKALGA